MKYPIGIQSFSEIRNGGYVYVDKTKQIYGLTQGKYYFLSRPRRFGKSLLLSTLNALYTGQKQLFQDLWIHEHWDWTQPPHPVIWLKFASMDYQGYGLEKALLLEIRSIATAFGVTLAEDDTLKGSFSTLLQSISGQQKVVLLIDEYDKPIIDYLDDIPQAEDNRAVLKRFYSVLKDADPYIELLFITGVSAFSKVSIFSDLNNLANISLEPQGYTLLGITQDELDTVFAEQMQQHDRARVRDWYNGYSWGGEERVYNPFSILR
ncbi:MAG: AAA family ATPase, partial [Bacteroidota bacterium]